MSGCSFWFYLILSLGYLARFVLSLMITVDTGFGGDVVILSIFSLLSCIISFIAFMFLAIAYSYNDVVVVSTKDYTYTSYIDVTKEDYKDTKARWDNQKYYFNRYLRTSYVSFIFSIGVIEETFRTDMLNKTYYDTYGVSYHYDSTKYMAYTIEAGVEFIFNIISICLECFCKNKI